MNCHEEFHPAVICAAVQPVDHDGYDDDTDTDSNSRDSRDVRISHTVTAIQMLENGLKLFYTAKRIQEAKTIQTNIHRFSLKFGVHPVTACSMYEDLQKTDIPNARLDDPDEKNLEYFLIALYYLRKYPTVDELESTFDYSPRWISRKAWGMTRRLQALKHDKICWPDNLNEDDIWILTVDGVHCWRVEPSDPEFSQNHQAYSHKLNKAGYAYELGVHLVGGLIWMNGPFDAGTNDITIFRKPNGLMERLQQLGKKAIGDFGYRGEPQYVSYPNSMDSKQLAMFKTRAQKRHETFNGMIKVFQILSGRFRHSTSNFAAAFEAVCVICQYKLENELPLYDVLIEAVVDASLGYSDSYNVHESSDSDSDE